MGDLSSCSTPTLGSCPICRQELYLFDLRYSQSGIKVHAQETNGGFNVPVELRGAIFVESTENYPGMIGRGSYHFPVNDNEPPYYDISKVPRKNDEITTLPLVDCHWHEPSRTFAGMLRPRKADQTISHQHVIFSFSADWRFVRQGVVLMRRKRDYKTTKEIQLAYPYDGKWKVLESVGSFLPQAFPDVKSFTVDGFGIVESLTHYPCMIRRDDKKDSASRPKIVFLASLKEFISCSSCDLDLGSEVIPIGYEWTWVDPNDPETKMVWKRESISSSIPADQANPIGGHSGRFLLRSTENENDLYLQQQQDSVDPVYNKASVWGNVFCQAYQVGLASYHFEGTGENGNSSVYISYESPSTGMWPPLDNGQVLPARVPFRNISFDTESRTFRGHICWQEDFGTSWQGMIRWEYEMVFDHDFTCIVAGHVNSVNSHNMEECMSRYGESLIYCNVKLWDVFRNELTSPGQEDDDNSQVDVGERYRTRSLELRVELQRQGASVRTVALVHRVFTAAQDPQGQNPFEGFHG